MWEESANAQRRVVEILARQHDAISFKQLIRAGITRSTISRRVREGWLHRIHRGVYSVGSPNLTREGYWMAAVLACGAEAVLSHQSAAALLGISPTSPATIHVTVPGPNGRRRRRGIVVHRSTTLTADDTTRCRGIPATSHARTLSDLGYGPEPTRSDLERDFLRLCGEHGIPKPAVNVAIGRYMVDFLWREERLIVETDGYHYHSGRAAFERDHARTNELIRLGYLVLRFTYREVSEQPQTVVASLRA